MKLTWFSKSKKKGQKGLFGGVIKSHEEIRALDHKINRHEAKQIEDAEAQIEEDLKNFEK
ncbi:MAG TPA: hypothetical protein VIT68_00620 [Candidatus Gracilibacteria bacterium]